MLMSLDVQGNWLLNNYVIDNYKDKFLFFVARKSENTCRQSNYGEFLLYVQNAAKFR